MNTERRSSQPLTGGRHGNLVRLVERLVEFAAYQAELPSLPFDSAHEVI